MPPLHSPGTTIGTQIGLQEANRTAHDSCEYTTYYDNFIYPYIQLLLGGIYSIDTQRKVVKPALVHQHAFSKPILAYAFVEYEIW